MGKTHISFDIPMPPQGILWIGMLFGFALFITIVAWLLVNWPYTGLRKKLPILHERPMTNLFVWFAIILFPIWLFLLALTIKGTFSLWFAEPSAASDAMTFRVHYIALVGLMTALAGLVSAPLAIHRLFTVERQTKAQEEGLITDRINKAVEGLGAEKIVKRIVETPKYKKTGKEWQRDKDGNLILALRPDGKPLIDREEIEETAPNLEVRVGAIFSLERIAQDSLRDHIQIMEILCAYICENAKIQTLEPTDDLVKRPKLRIDIQTAISVLGRRSITQKSVEKSHNYRLNIRWADLSGAEMDNSDFSGAIFANCKIEAAFIRNSDLTGTRFFGSILNYTDFSKAKMNGTRFDHAIINRPILHRGEMSESITFADINAITVSGADITALNYLGEFDNKRNIFGTKDTKLNTDLSFDINEYQKLWFRRNKARRDSSYQDIGYIESEMDSMHAFPEFMPFDSNDMMYGAELARFMENRGCVGWPHT